ncbi:MAG: hypothetical protein WEA10_05000 [Actinomycetota bacterium]
MTQATAPGGLGTAGRALWDQMTEDITYRPDEYAVLAQACKLLDTIATLQAAVDGAPLTVTGSTGQQVINPLLIELRLTRAELTRQLARIDVPTEEDEETRSTKARRSANARWHGGSVGSIVDAR